MVHYSLIDVLLQFRLNRILTADVSWMYRAIALVESNKDLHRFVWRTSLHDRVKSLHDQALSRITELDPISTCCQGS